ncbi:MAG: 50S ribosomal protein L27 [Candidatus Portnoybacteria bacterium CG10_big_fil_rev_8_21_14_0_10_36_7]|uniref:Large ribosomal subunit protein bL27 n=1 Tax=Candidatus Portnoybacteria bacterium CG10_big_fil_rev_8_21_14_0_10_36_7 TaxID=1974812 RepID=A0A2M8KDS3_9BACT|nr:MAG: 50S ribosomal protein L27 [Candidatus Portnoybacteria bacterium CG10_big_fil_rev_8_21_14_0_10_36_7]
MAHTKAAGSTKLGRDSHAQRLGVKLFEGEKAKAGFVLIRQRGLKYLPGQNVRVGSDDTLYAFKPGVVKFSQKRKKRFDGKLRIAKVVNVV